jgi:hypothetical protein
MAPPRLEDSYPPGIGSYDKFKALFDRFSR